MTLLEIDEHLKQESEAAPDLEFCAECKNNCIGIWEDVGIGGYEYWGQKGVDVRWAYMSNCCEAEVIKNGQLYEGPEWDEGNQADYLYEQERDRQLAKQFCDEE